jgi:hypothetical protein
VRFYYLDRNFLNSISEVEKYRTTVTKPDEFLPFKELQTEKEFDSEMDRKWDDKEFKSVDIAAAGAEEYAVYGWA